MTPTIAPAPADGLKPLRRDAAENRERLIEAAALVFGSHGLDAGVEEVAREAGVGMGTLYRRFPTKQALIDELIGTIRRELLALARNAATQPDGVGLEIFLTAAGEVQSAQSGCLARLWNHSEAELAAMQDLRDLVADMLTAAKEYGRIRADVTNTDISMMHWGMRGVIEMTRLEAPSAWRRYLELQLAGLRPVCAGPFDQPLKAKPLSPAQALRVSAADK